VPARRLLGSQTPTHRLVPKSDFTRGPDAIEVGEIASYQLDPYQKQYLNDGLGVVVVPSTLHRDRRLVERWAASEVGIELSRQNGKSVAKEVRCIAGVYLFGERRIVYSAHKFETVMDAQQRIADALHSDPELKAEVKAVRIGNGKEAIEFYSGQVIRFRTRTAGGGRGLDGDCVVLDESQALIDDHIAALMPLVSARPNPQLWYAGSAGGKTSTVQASLVRNCLAGKPNLVYWRFAADETDPAGSPQTWAKVNPALGRRITLMAIETEYNRMSRVKFGMERLGIGDYPRAEGEDWVIPRRRWEAAEDQKSSMIGSVAFAVEVSWDMLNASIGVSGWRRDGSRHLEVIANEHGTAWVAEDLKGYLAKHEHLGVVLDPGGPANVLIGPLRDVGISTDAGNLRLLKSGDLTQAYGSLYTGLMAPKPIYRHTGSGVLTSALADAATRKVGGSTTWRRAGEADVSPLLAVTWAAHALSILEKPKAPPPSPELLGPSAADLVAAGAAGAHFDPATSGF